MKVWIAYMFLTIFSLQVLPVKEVGKILFKNQITEEEVRINGLAEEDAPCKAKKQHEPLQLYSGSNQSLASLKYLNSVILNAIHTTERLPNFYIPDITTPPPNHC